MTAGRKTMRIEQEPVISRSALTDRVYLTTDYVVLNPETGAIVANAKVDITRALEAFLGSERAS